jgi:hypothetical protein
MKRTIDAQTRELLTVLQHKALECVREINAIHRIAREQLGISDQDGVADDRVGDMLSGDDIDDMLLLLAVKVDGARAAEQADGIGAGRAEPTGLPASSDAAGGGGIGTDSTGLGASDPTERSLPRRDDEVGVGADDPKNRGADEFYHHAIPASGRRNDSGEAGETRVATPSSAITVPASRLPVENRDSGITSDIVFTEVPQLDAWEDDYRRVIESCEWHRQMYAATLLRRVWGTARAGVSRASAGRSSHSASQGGAG